MQGTVKWKAAARLANFLSFRSTASPATGLYIYPAGEVATAYDRVINARLAHPSVPVVVTINPGSGPGR